MVSDDRLKEVVEFAATNGDKQCCEVFCIPQETLNRYKRSYRSSIGEISDVMGRMRDKFSDAEMEAMLSLNMGKQPINSEIISFAGDDITFLALSDDHIGSVYFEEQYLLSAFEEAKAQGCQFLINAGDIIEGMSGRPGHIYELSHLGYAAQRKEAIRLYSQWGLPAYVIEGNHPAWINTKQEAGMNIIEDICDAVPGMKYLGSHEGNVVINGVRLMLWHGIDGNSYATSYRIQKIVEAFTGGEKPHALFCGHTHKQLYLFDRNVHCISTGCIQKQSGFMRYKKLPAHIGFWIIKMTIADGEIKRFTPTWYPFYK